VYIWTQLPGPRNGAGAALLTTSTLLWTGVRPHSRGRAHPLRPGRGVHDDVAESHQRAATSPAAARLLQESCRPSAVLAACSQEKLLPPPARLSGPFQCAHAPARSTAVSLAGTVLQAAGGRAAIAVADRRRLAGPRLAPRCPSLAARPSLSGHRPDRTRGLKGANPAPNGCTKPQQVCRVRLDCGTPRARIRRRPPRQRHPSPTVAMADAPVPAPLGILLTSGGTVAAVAPAHLPLTVATSRGAATVYLPPSLSKLAAAQAEPVPRAVILAARGAGG
jgi:hypothetical protein